jgi:murein DD-endopeptidase MepM/ murein hydrolase activator NlpD
MNAFKIYWPAKPFVLNQGWGIYNPIYQQFGFSRHNGIDIALGTDKKLYAPCDGQIVRIGSQPTGGGNYFGMMTGPWDFADGSYRVLLDFLHCESISVQEGQMLKVGDFMAIADNTGFSNGPHTHIQPRRVKFWNGQFGTNLAWTTEDVNDANNSFDPLPYFGNFYAVDIPHITQLQIALVGALQKLLALLQKK